MRFTARRAPRERAARLSDASLSSARSGLLANAVQNAIQNSPIAEGKKLVVKMLAGDYDEAAARAELDRLIASEPVVMFSFPK